MSKVLDGILDPPADAPIIVRGNELVIGSLHLAVNLLLALALLGLLLAACSVRPLLYDVRVVPEAITPNGDGDTDVTHVFYRLSRSANLSIYFVDAGGQTYYFRRERRRSPGSYDVYWGGVIEGESLYQNDLTREVVRSRVLPDGQYTWVVEATGDGGQRVRHEGPITISQADTEVPELRNFTVAPPTFTPNQDGIADRASISYFLSKPVDEVRVYLIDPADPDFKYPLAEKAREIEPGELGYHFYDYDGGVDLGADPPPDGTYTVWAEARDRVGNHVIVTSTLTIVEGGKPRADVVNGDVDWQGAVGTEMWLPLGSTIVFTTVVENYGHVPIRTAGPWPGTEYRYDQNFNTLAVEQGQEAWHEQAGVWRFGIKFDVSLSDFPYRWAVGRPEDLERRVIDGREQWFLPPGQRGLVTGRIVLSQRPPREDIFAWGALIHEYVGIKAENNYVDRVLVHVGLP